MGMYESNELKSKGLLAQIRGPQAEVSPFLKTRVLARLEERRKEKKKVLFWRWLGSLSVSGLALFIFINSVFLPDKAFKAKVSQPHVVRVEINELRDQAVGAEILLPDGVEFVSESFPELVAQRSLALEWGQNFDGEFFPFVIKSNKAGNAKVLIKLKNSSGAVIQEKIVHIKFVVDKGVKS